MPKEIIQQSLFDNEENPEQWKEEWKGMPEFIQEDLAPFQSVIIHFENKDALVAFSKLIEQKITYKTISLWFPKANVDIVKNIRYTNES